MSTKKPRKIHTQEFKAEALKLAQKIGVAAAARELNLYESQLYNWRSNPIPRLGRQNLLPRSQGLNANLLNKRKIWPS